MTLLALCGRAEVPWKECHVMDERVKFIARMLDGEAMPTWPGEVRAALAAFSADRVRAR